MSLTVAPVLDVAPPFVVTAYEGSPASITVAPVFDVAAPFVLPGSGPTPAPSRRFVVPLAVRPVVLAAYRRVAPDRAVPGPPPATT